MVEFSYLPFYQDKIFLANLNELTWQKFQGKFVHQTLNELTINIPLTQKINNLIFKVRIDNLNYFYTVENYELVNGLGIVNLKINVFYTVIQPLLNSAIPVKFGHRHQSSNRLNFSSIEDIRKFELEQNYLFNKLDEKFFKPELEKNKLDFFYMDSVNQTWSIFSAATTTKFDGTGNITYFQSINYANQNGGRAKSVSLYFLAKSQGSSYGNFSTTQEPFVLAPLSWGLYFPNEGYQRMNDWAFTYPSNANNLNKNYLALISTPWNYTNIDIFNNAGNICLNLNEQTVTGSNCSSNNFASGINATPVTLPLQGFFIPQTATKLFPPIQNNIVKNTNYGTTPVQGAYAADSASGQSNFWGHNYNYNQFYIPPNNIQSPLIKNYLKNNFWSLIKTNYLEGVFSGGVGWPNSYNYLQLPEAELQQKNWTGVFYGYNIKSQSVGYIDSFIFILPCIKNYNKLTAKFAQKKIELDLWKFQIQPRVKFNFSYPFNQINFVYYDQTASESLPAYVEKSFTEDGWTSTIEANKTRFALAGIEKVLGMMTGGISGLESSIRGAFLSEGAQALGLGLNILAEKRSQSYFSEMHGSSDEDDALIFNYEFLNLEDLKRLYFAVIKYGFNYKLIDNFNSWKQQPQFNFLQILDPMNLFNSNLIYPLNFYQEAKNLLAEGVHIVDDLNSYQYLINSTVESIWENGWEIKNQQNLIAIPRVDKNSFFTEQNKKTS